VNYLFIIAGFIDFQRRLFMCKACGALITPFKDSYEVKYQILPTLNIFSK
jgi:hypothetical protein